jgi:hypothetical protein
MTIGKNLYDFFIIPTIRIDKRYLNYTRITFEWLNFYVGFVIEYNKEEN